ncbi:type II toxin-antitoxin system ParD family antitoxin [Streptosporangium sp. NPDC048865]|uniref:ribbon-helix-helix domain-containing protein n=1 Tax=Streptosporangium sp. NPDC048865 TaxID=3155766 RepID=UPI003412D83E
MDTSVTISPQDSFFIEHCRREKRFASRSAVIRRAIRLLRESVLEEERAAAASVAAGESWDADSPGFLVDSPGFIAGDGSGAPPA